jgi:hypothetical protein
VGVVVRRGAGEWTQLSLWHTDTDTFEHGQWMRNRIYSRRADLSPDGSLFIYFARASGGPTPAHDTAESWVAISRPPWFTALALWFVGSTWCVGGYFASRTAVCPGAWTTPPDQGTLPSWLTLSQDFRYVDHTNNWTDRTVFISRLLRGGWQHTPGATPRTVDTWQRDQPGGRLTLVYVDRGWNPRAYGGPHVVEYALRDEAHDEIVPLRDATWADWDHRGRLVLASHGRLQQWRPGGPGNPAGSMNQLADFNPHTPLPAPSPPQARQWPPPPVPASRP